MKINCIRKFNNIQLDLHLYNIEHYYKAPFTGFCRLIGLFLDLWHRNWSNELFLLPNPINLISFLKISFPCELILAKDQLHYRMYSVGAAVLGSGSKSSVIVLNHHFTEFNSILINCGIYYLKKCTARTILGFTFSLSVKK